MFVAALHQPHSSPATHGQRQPAFGKFAISLPKEKMQTYITMVKTLIGVPLYFGQSLQYHHHTLQFYFFTT